MQIDFLGQDKARLLYQTSLFDESGKVLKQRASIDYSKANAFFQTLDAATIEAYKQHWSSLAPKNDAERFQKWLFSFMSVHTTYESNVRGYRLLKNWTSWFNLWDILAQKLTDSRAGLNKARHPFIKAFAEHYWNNPDYYKKADNESWQQFRDRLEKRILGLGFAKVSFAIEMMYPNEAQVACMDVHLYRLYGLDQSRDSALGRTIEKHFVDMSRVWNCPPAIARAIMWDRQQKQGDSSYWTYVFNEAWHYPKQLILLIYD